jgi:hypothetical protein
MIAAGTQDNSAPSAAAAAAQLKHAVAALSGPNAADANAWLNRSAAEWSAAEALQVALTVLAEFEAFCNSNSNNADPNRRREEEAAAFFAANLLLKRVRSSAVWGQLSPQEREHVTSAAGRSFSAAVNAGFPAVARRLGHALALHAALSGPEAAAAFSGQCLSALGGGSDGGSAASAVAWSALDALEQEISSLEAGRRRPLSAAVVQASWAGVAGRAADAIARAAAALSGSDATATAESAAVAEAAARTVIAWLRLEGGPVGGSGASAASAALSGGRCRLSPAEFCSRHAALAEALLRCIGRSGGINAGAGSSPALEAAERLEAAAADALALALGPSAAPCYSPASASTATANADADAPSSLSPEQQQRLLQQAKLEERAALTGALRALVSSARPGILVPGPGGAATARAAALVAAAVAERDPELAAGCPPSTGASAGASGMATSATEAEAEVALAVASLIADVLLGRRERASAAAAADFLLALNEAPVAQRAPGLGAPLFTAAVRALLKHTRLPRSLAVEGGDEGAGDGEDNADTDDDDDDDDDDDEDEFWQLRETVWAELAEASFGVVGPAAFFTAVAEGLRGGGSGGGGGTGGGAGATAAANGNGGGNGGGGGDWRAVEGALYALKVVAAPARARANNNSGQQQQTQQQDDAGAMLRRLFEEVCAAGTPACAAVASHPLAARQAAQCLAAYAAWFGSAAADALAPPPSARSSSPGVNHHAALSSSPGAGCLVRASPPPPPPPLEGALRLLLHALGFPAVCGREAAHAFRVLCTRCAEPLAAAGPGAIAALADAAAARVAPPFDLAAAVAAFSAAGAGVAAASSAGGAPDKAASSSFLSYDDRAAVFEGLARVAAALPSPEAVGDAALRLLRPHLARAEAVVAAAATLDAGAAPSSSASSSTARAACVAALADEVRLIGALMRAMDLPPSSLRAHLPRDQQPPHPALRVLEGAWPLLSAAARSPLASSGGAGAINQNNTGPDSLVAAAMAVFDSALQAARHRARPLLPALLATSREVFSATAHPAALRTLAVLTDTFGEARAGAGGGVAAILTLSAGGAAVSPDPSTSAATEQQQQQLAAAQRDALESALAVSAAAVGWAGPAAGQALPELGSTDRADLARALLAAGDAYLVFARDLLLLAPPTATEGALADQAPPPLLSALCAWATAALSLREREPVSAALAFWSHLLALLPKAGGASGAGGSEDDASAAAAQTAALRCAGAHGPALVAALVKGLTDTLPRAALRPAASSLHALLTSPAAGPAAGRWLVDALRAALVASAGTGGGGAPPLQPADVERFALLATRGTPAAVATGAAAAAAGGGGGAEVIVLDGDDGGSTTNEPLPRRRFDALVSDFASLARGEGTAEALLAYEL